MLLRGHYINNLIFYNLKIQIIMSRFAQVRDLVMSLESDFEKFYDKGNQAAGTRVRGGLQALKTLAQEIRTEVQAKKNAGN
ncbi:MAG: hypothetical protein RJA76_1083 [Bacteroidota bacterium]|jgi:hypothetical protein